MIFEHFNARKQNKGTKSKIKKDTEERSEKKERLEEGMYKKKKKNILKETINKEEIKRQKL